MFVDFIKRLLFIGVDISEDPCYNKQGDDNCAGRI